MNVADAKGSQIGLTLFANVLDLTCLSLLADQAFQTLLLELSNRAGGEFDCQLLFGRLQVFAAFGFRLFLNLSGFVDDELVHLRLHGSFEFVLAVVG